MTEFRRVLFRPVRGVLRALGVMGAIKSPTYALVESYDTTKGEVHHLDAYRIASVDDVEARGGFEYFQSPSIQFVEWPERLPGAVAFDVELRFDFEGEGRRVTLACSPLPGGEGLGVREAVLLQRMTSGGTTLTPTLSPGEREPNP